MMVELGFSEQTVQKVWEKGFIVPPHNSNIWRKDKCGAWMKRNEYGNRNSISGWEIDHINCNGGDFLGNLQPLQWENNCAKSDGPLRCVRP